MDYPGGFYEVILLLLLSVSAEGRLCINRLVLGKWISHGNCMSQDKVQSVLNGIINHPPEETAVGQGVWSDWSQWSMCTQTCGRSSRLRTRTCLGSVTCLGRRSQISQCKEQVCPGVWSKWSELSPCSKTCGAGISTRTRFCLGPGPCIGGKSEINPCKRPLCPDPTSCYGTKLEDFLNNLRNRTGGEKIVNIQGIGLRNVYCDVTTDGGNWIVFQRRMDGTVDFYRDWKDYVSGFGSVRGEHWLGLEAIHQLTKNGEFEIRIDMIARDGVRYFAKYSSFSVGPAADKFRLSVSGHSGNIEDSFANKPGSIREQNGQQFTTRDSDNDKCKGTCNCAKALYGGWWYNWCSNVNLNGDYHVFTPSGVWRGMLWINKSEWLYMKFVEMKLRQKF